MTISKQDVQKLYIAYFGRPMDPGGATYYAAHADNLVQVARIFSSSPESKALYSAGSTQDLVTAIYQNIFGRDPEPAGLQYWSNLLDTDALSSAEAALIIMSGAQGSDATVVENKLLVAQAFTDALDTEAEKLGYSGLISASVARTFLGTVRDAPVVIADLQPALDKAVAEATGTGTGTGTGTDTGSSTPTPPLPFSANISSGTVTFSSPGAKITLDVTPAVPSGEVYTFTSTGGSSGTSSFTTSAITGIVVPTGTTLTLSNAVATGVSFTGAGTVKISDTGHISAVDLVALDANVAGLLDASSFTDITGSLDDVAAMLVTNQGASGNKVKTASDIGVVISGTPTASAADLNAIDTATTGFVNATSVDTITGTLADAALLMVTNAGTSGDKIGTSSSLIVNLSDTGTASAGDLNAINVATNGKITGSGITGIAGASTDVQAVLSASKVTSVLSIGAISDIQVTDKATISLSRSLGHDPVITLADFDGNYVLISSGTSVASGILTIDGSAMTSGHGATFNSYSLSSLPFKVIGGAGNDSFRGSLGDDILNGGGGNDRIEGNDGNDTIDGGAGKDMIYGGEGNDTINGGDDNDFINGGNGADTLTGGAGADTFYYFEPMEGGDTITDFDQYDRILVSELDFPGYGTVIVRSGSGGYNDALNPDGSGSLMLYTDTSTGITSLYADYNGNGGGYSYLVVTFAGGVTVNTSQIQFTDYSGDWQWV